MVKFTVDYENNAETFWAAIKSQLPALAAKFVESDSVELTDDEAAAVKALPGWADGPEHAKTALIEG
jgi:hypothetical protein